MSRERPDGSACRWLVPRTVKIGARCDDSSVVVAVQSVRVDLAAGILGPEANKTARDYPQ